MSFNPSISHYRREHAPIRLYLSSDISILEMYNDYLVECTNTTSKAYSYSLYAQFVKSLNISFAHLGIEKCEDCQEFQIHLQSSSQEKEPEEDNEGGEDQDDDKRKIG